MTTTSPDPDPDAGVDASVDASVDAPALRRVWNAAERAAFDTLYHAMREPLYLFACARVGADQAGETLSDLWLRLTRRWPDLHAACQQRLAADPARTEQGELQRLAWTSLNHLLIDVYKRRARRARLAPLAPSVHASDDGDGDGDPAGLMAVALPVEAPENPGETLQARETFTRILARCTPTQRAIVVLLVRGLEPHEVRDALAAQGITYRSTTGPRMAVARLMATLQRHEPDLDLAGRTPLNQYRHDHRSATSAQEA